MSLAPPPTYDTIVTTSLKPYLELPHLYSLTWLAYPILSLFFIAFRLYSSLESSQESIASAKATLLASCKAAEKAATATASMPRYLAVATNQQYADAVNGTLQLARATLVVALTMMEAIINFIIDIYQSTLLCFVELVVRGGLAILSAAVKELNDVVNAAASGIESALNSSISAANSAIETAVKAINAVNPFDDVSAPTISTPDLSALSNVSLPSSFTDSIDNLNSSLPSVQELKQKIEAIIDTPFELLKKEINDTFGGLNFNSSLVTVPQQNTLTFCNDMDTSVVDDLGRDIIKFTKISIVVLIALALLLIALNCLLEWYKWRCQQRHFEYTREAWMTDPTMYHVPGAVGTPQVSLTNHNLLMLQASSSHPLLTRIINQVSARLHLSPPQHTNMTWFFHYIFHPPALVCFLIGFFGILSVQLQLLALGPLVAKYDAQAAASTADFTNTIATSINNSMYNQSAAYANDVNSQVTAMQSTINDGIFGWVNTTTTTLNDTVVEFYNGVQSAVNAVFNGTILETPAQDFIACLIGSKVDAIENVLTFLNENLQVDLPLMNESALVLSQSSIDEASQPIAAAALGSGSGDENDGLVGKLVRAYAASLKKERIMFVIFLALWGVVVLMAICILLWHTHGKGWVEVRKRRKWEREQRSGNQGFVVPFRIGQPVADEKAQTRNYSSESVSAPASPRRGFNFPFVRTRSRSPFTQPAEKSWDSYFGEKPDAPAQEPISRPQRLMAIGKKALGKDRSVSDGQQENGTTPWYGRFAGLLSKKRVEEPVSEQSSTTSPRVRPNLRISVGRAATATPSFPPVDNPRDTLHSHWSASPELARPAPWAKMLSPPFKLSPRRPNVPSDVNSVYEPDSLAPPLHHGFDHRRSYSDSAWMKTDPSSILNARKEDPFTTPFDDEHRVTINHTGDARKSIPTNPFAAVAI
ncbi:related to Plasma membrane fusion protein PRM1 [Armillaria ostoyae]|uniref:Plasma membrane fusion protein PRM1 n=1 Tax=Armillaria ostoyae TaxID=47428 RepID=A0A284QKY7_ARMOS|nr:related to Plasma membrane fusion protein PRM1 [Armillaria ostoyae]